MNVQGVTYVFVSNSSSLTRNLFRVLLPPFLKHVEQICYDIDIEFIIPRKKMLPSEQLEKMLTQEIAPDLEDYIDDLFEKIADSKTATQEDKDELQQAQELREDFKEMYNDLQEGDMDEEECQEIIDELIEMRQDDEDE